MENAKTAAVIVAAGSSTRMGVPKQLMLLGGIPVIARTLRAFDHARTISEMVLVVREEDMAAMQDILHTYPVCKPVRVMKGGTSRQQSSFKGVNSIGADIAFVAIHDGDRPLISPETIDRVVTAAYTAQATAAAVPVKDTIKIVDDNGIVVSTPDRRTLWSVQTPQVFAFDRYRQWMAQAESDGKEFTDDCQLAESAGYPVQLIEAEYRNVKITTPEDITIAEEMLRG